MAESLYRVRDGNRMEFDRIVRRGSIVRAKAAIEKTQSWKRQNRTENGGERTKLVDIFEAEKRQD